MQLLAYSIIFFLNKIIFIMKKFSIFLLLVFGFFAVFGQKVELTTAKKGDVRLQVKKIDQNDFMVQLPLKLLKFTQQQTKGGDFFSFTSNYLARTYDVGKPMLPAFSRLIEVPQGADVQVTVVSYDEEIIDLNKAGITKKIAPAQPSLRKDIDPKDAPFYYNEATYSTNAFYAPDKIAFYEYEGQMRATRLGRIQINPFAYNPVTNQLKVYNNIVIKVTFVHPDWQATSQIKAKYSSPYFTDGSDVVLNPGMIPTPKALTQSVPVTYVIVAPPEFRDSLQPFVEWKKLKGFDVIEAYTDDPNVGSTISSIKSYLQNLYENPTNGHNPPSFILIVGDIEQIPATQHTEVSDDPYSDLDYAEYTGDYIPEVNYGRWSAETPQQVAAIVAKTVRYERYEMADPSYLGHSFLVAGDDEGHEDTYGGGAIWYADNYYMGPATNLDNHLWLQSTIESWGGNTAGNNLAHDSIIYMINQGVAWANYTAHCSPDGWYEPSFTQNDLNNYITNTDKFGLWIGNCCQSNKFDENEAFAELAIRKPNAGVIDYIGASQYTYWDGDYYWAVGVADISANPTYENSTEGCYDALYHTKSNEANDVSTWGITAYQFNMAGLLATEAAPDDGNLSYDKRYYWCIYQVAGDPSIMPYVGIPDPLSVTLNPAVLLIGTSSVDVTTEPYAYIAFTLDGQQIGVAQADASGNATVNFSQALTGSEITLVVTAQFKQPYIQTIQPIAANEPYVLVSSYTPDTVAYNGSYSIDALFKNVADSGYDASGVTAVLTTDDPYVTITDSIANVGTVNGGDTVEIENAFSYNVASNAPDQHLVRFTVTMTGSDAKYIWTSNLKVMINAPKLQGQFSYIDDSNGQLIFASSPDTVVISNSQYKYNVQVKSLVNGSLDTGENDILNFETTNNGHAGIYNAYGHLTTTSPYITINSDETHIDTLNVGESFTSQFNISVSDDAPEGTLADFTFVFGNEQYKDTVEQSLPLGLVIESFETGDFSAYNWQQGGNTPWQVVTTDPQDGSYCAESGDVDDSQSSELSIQLNGVPAGQTMSFYYKVSSEQNYDFLKFYVNGTEVQSWSGNIAWTQYTYTFPSAGDYTIKFAYEKDYSVSEGSDCGWIDNIVFPVAPAKAKGAKAITITAPTLPSWASLNDNGNGTAVISGTAPATAESDSVVLLATDGSRTVTQGFTIRIEVTDIYTLNNHVSFYPNPTADVLNIELSKVENGTLTITAVNGQVVMSKNLTEKNTQIDVSNFAKGLYLIKINIEGQTLTNKLIIK